MFSDADYRFMSEAIQIAKKGQYTTSPNPNVGCIIVKDGKIIGQGWHQMAGRGHAEVNALSQLTPIETANATAYVTLEPCSHYGRTPPCAKKLIDAKVKSVVVAMLDPNPLVAGNGIRILEAAGIDVKYGLLEQDARALNPGFLSRMERKRPFVTVKLAASIDGKTALSNGESKWITGASARRDVQTYRAKSCAILTSATTVLQDDAQMNVRENQLNFEYPTQQFEGQIRQPLKIILDGQNRLNAERLDGLAITKGNAKIVLIKSVSTGDFEGSKNITEVVLPYDKINGFHVEQILDWCGANEINNLWVEAGGKLCSSFIETQLFDLLVVYLAPKVMGDAAQSMLPIGPFKLMAECMHLKFHSVVPVGEDLKISLVKRSTFT